MTSAKFVKSAILLAVLCTSLSAMEDFAKIKSLIDGSYKGKGSAGQASATSSVRVYPDLGVVVKHVKDFLQYGVLEREVDTLLKLKGLPHIPKLLYVDYDNNSIYMEYGGKKLDKTNVPADWQNQVKAIIAELRSRGVYHNDIKDAEVLVNDQGTIMLIDYGWAAPGPKNEDIGKPIPGMAIDVSNGIRGAIGGSYKAPGERDDRFSIVKAVRTAQGLSADNKTVQDLVKDIFGTSSKITIIKASYGVTQKQVDVTDKLQAALDRNPRALDGKADTLNKLFGDPKPNAKKMLNIIYRVRGSDKEQSRELGETEAFAF